MSKAFATSTKLSETNYMIWYAGILTVLLGVTFEPYAKLMKVLELIQNRMHNSIEVIYNGIGTHVFKDSLFKDPRPAMAGPQRVPVSERRANRT